MSQLGFGPNDAVGSPFQYLNGSNAIVSGSTITMVSNRLIIDASGTTAALTVVLPLNPPDGCVAEIDSTHTITALTISANTGDSIIAGVLGTPTTIVPAASTGNPSALGGYRYAYTLNGCVVNGVALNPRSWVRVA